MMRRARLEVNATVRGMAAAFAFSGKGREGGSGGLARAAAANGRGGWAALEGAATAALDGEGGCGLAAEVAMACVGKMGKTTTTREEKEAGVSNGWQRWLVTGVGGYGWRWLRLRARDAAVVVTLANGKSKGERRGLCAGGAAAEEEGSGDVKWCVSYNKFP
ncbi:hypothetical protein BHE74_00027530 [Ensete ventricosum]|nr:hypothetical protein BHE74_00027530 [Ensete ventricosum]